MGLNRYSTLPKINIKDTQALPDLGIYDKTLARKQLKYDTKAAQLGSTVQGAESMQLFGNTANAYKGKVVNDLKSKVGEISNMDLADPNVTKGADQYIQQVAADPELKKHIQAKQMYDNYNDTKEKLAVAGKLPTSADILRQQAWNHYSEKGELLPEAVEPLYEAQNLIKGRGELVDMIKSSGSAGTAFYQGIAYGNSSSGVSYDRLDKAVKSQLNTYANSIYGKQEHDDYTVAKMQGSIPANMKFEDYLLKNVMSTAQNYAHSNTSNDYSAAFNKKADKDAEKFEGEGYAPAMSSGNDVEVDSDGKFDQPWYMDAFDAGKELVTGEKSDSRTAEQKAQIAKLEKNRQAAGYKGSLADYAKEVHNADPSIKVTYFSAKESEAQSKKFWDGKTKGGTAINTRVWDEGSGTWMPFNEFLEENDISPEEAKEGFTLVGKISPDNHLGLPTGTQAVVGGKSVILDTSSSKPTAEELYVHKVSQAKYNPDRKNVFKMRDASGRPFEYTSVVVGNGQPQVTERLITEEEFNN